MREDKNIIDWNDFDSVIDSYIDKSKNHLIDKTTQIDNLYYEIIDDIVDGIMSGKYEVFKDYIGGENFHVNLFVKESSNYTYDYIYHIKRATISLRGDDFIRFHTNLYVSVYPNAKTKYGELNNKYDGYIYEIKCHIKENKDKNNKKTRILDLYHLMRTAYSEGNIIKQNSELDTVIYYTNDFVEETLKKEKENE